MSQAYCTGCGTALAPGAAFCTNCGRPAEAQAAPPPAPVYAPPPAPAYAPPPATPAPQAYAAPPAYPPQPAAPGYSHPAGYAPQPASDHEYVQGAYVGPNADYYIGTWREMAATGKPNSWNWSAFWFSAFWLAYRKMWMPALGTAAAIVALQVGAAAMPGSRNVFNALIIVVCAVIGWRANSLYRAQVDRMVGQASLMTPDRQGQAGWLQQQGGVALPAAIGLVVAVGAIGAFLIMAASNQPLFRTSRYSAPPPSPSSPTTSSGAVTESWLVGTWGFNGCVQYIRFAADHTLSDNAGTTGSWMLSSTGDLRMVTARETRGGQVSQDGSNLVITSRNGRQVFQRCY